MQAQAVPLTHLRDHLLDRLRKEIAKSKKDYDCLFKDYQQALSLYNQMRLEKMKLEEEVDMLERVLVERREDDNPSPVYYGR